MKKRQNKKQEIGNRSLRLRMGEGGKPASLDEANRSVEIVVATETDTVLVYDWELGRVPEILLMSGCRPVEQVPLLDTHSRDGVANVLGSVRDFRIEGDEQLGRAYYSTVKEADDAYTKTKEGHLTDYSAGYRPISTTVVAEKETVTLGGRSFTGPCLVITEWELREVSTCPIGADNRAKARALDSINQEEEIMLKEFLRKMRGELGLPEDATEDQVRAAIEDAAKVAAKVAEDAKRTPAGPASAKTATEPVDPDAAARKAVAEERTRTAEITALCEAHECRDLVAEMLQTGVTVAEAQRKVLDALKTRAGSSSPGFRHMSMGTDERDKYRSAATDALLLNGGIVITGREADPSARDLRGMNLRELARDCLFRANQSTSGDIRDIVSRALTTSDLPNILSNVAHLSLLSGFEAAAETYEEWCDTTGALSDFKLSDLTRKGETSDLEEIKEDGEFTYGKTADTKETVKLATFGKIIAFTRQAIINDSLGLITDTPKDMGEACARLQGDLAYGVLIANAKMADGKELFHSGHGNLAASGGVVSMDALDAADLAMGLQKDLLGKRSLNIAPMFLIGPRSIKGSAERFFATELIGGEENSPNIRNTWFGPKLTRVYDTRLDADDVHAWYLAAAKGKTVKLFYLNGSRTPFMEQKTGWSRDGVEFKVRMDAAAKAVSWQGLYMNPGQ